MIVMTSSISTGWFGMSESLLQCLTSILMWIEYGEVVSISSISLMLGDRKL